ncbi:MAG: hypothetical protein P8I27_15390 [Pirellulaceae bacterium]|nr:hypothetical protein [Pirellulaceae bacterium]
MSIFEPPQIQRGKVIETKFHRRNKLKSEQELADEKTPDPLF